MRWPFGPLHLTLKPSPKKTNKKPTKSKKQEKLKKHKYQTMSFSVISQFFLLVGVQTFPFLRTWPKKRSPPQNTIKIGVSAKHCFEKRLCVTKRPILDKKTNSEIPVIIFWAYSFSFNNKKPNILLKPLFSLL